jgi:Fe-S-cluster containining protein
MSLFHRADERRDPPSLAPADLAPSTAAPRSPPIGTATCSACDAVCCRLTVVVQPEDGIAEHLTTRLNGLRVMARDAEGWCVAMDATRMCCSIYDARPDVCRRFSMGGPHCEAVREDYLRDGYPIIHSTLLENPL